MSNANLKFERAIDLPVSQTELWDWHMRPSAFERLSPPWQRIENITTPSGGLTVDMKVSFELKKGPVRKRWVARISQADPPSSFTDVQESGPFAHWKHRHMMQSTGQATSRLLDSVEYALPFGLNRIGFARRFGRGELERLFRFRHTRMVADLQRWGGGQPGKGKRVLISGISGMIGRQLAALLSGMGYDVRGLSRSANCDGCYQWDPAAGSIDPAALEGVHTVIHLAGANIASGRWTKQRKEAILASRVHGTRTLIGAIEKASTRPEVFISASGINAYPEGKDINTESSKTQRETFLGEVCAQWEAEALAAERLGCRIVLMRTGVVLDPSGGALGKMLFAYMAGLGGPIAGGHQHISWIGIEDLIDLYVTAIVDPRYQGPVNAVAPECVNQATFNRILGRTVNRPAVLPLPGIVVRGLLGQMGRETLLSNLRVSPQLAMTTGFDFRHPDLSSCLAHLLGRKGTE